MTRKITALAVTALLVLASATVPIATMAQSTETPTPTDGSDDPGNATAQSSELLQGVLAVQQAEVEGELRTRSFGIRVAQAASDDAKAEVVASELEDIEGRLEELEQRKAQLEREREAGNISRSTYRAEMAKLAVETETVSALSNQSANATAGLPADLLERKGINATAIRTLSTRADELSGPQVSRIARSIAGSSVAVEAGATDRADNATRRGPPADGDRAESSDADSRNRTDTDAGQRSGEDARGNETRSGTATPEDGSDEQTTDTATPEHGSDEQTTDTATPEDDSDEQTTDTATPEDDGGSDGSDAGTRDGSDSGGSDAGARSMEGA